MKKATQILGVEVHLYLIYSCMQNKAFTQTFTQIFKYQKSKQHFIVGYKETWRKYKISAKNYLRFSFRKRTGLSIFRVSWFFYPEQARLLLALYLQ